MYADYAGFDTIDDAFNSVGIQTESVSDTANKVSKECDDNGLQNLMDVKEEKTHQIFYGLTTEDREQAVLEGIVPRVYKNSTFDIEKIKENLRGQFKKSKGLYKIFKLNEYEAVCDGILSAIRMKKLPSRSYLIGAPNGFGKSSFVNECLITLRKQGFKVAPYISLWELAQIRVDNEHRIMNPYRKFKDEQTGVDYTEPNKIIGYMKKPEIITGRYSYSEYINADCLFVSFTDVISKDIESHTLYQLLSIRGAKGLPTIVMMSTSLEPYENDKVLKELVWDEIKAYNESDGCYDRVYHVSCYKQRAMGLDTKGATVDSSTGIVTQEM